MIGFDRYEAFRDSDDEYVYSVVRRRWFGFGAPQVRRAVWDGHIFNENGTSKPDWHWANHSGHRTPRMVRFSARNALLREWCRFHPSPVPMPWSAPTTALLLRGEIT